MQEGPVVRHRVKWLQMQCVWSCCYSAGLSANNKRNQSYSASRNTLWRCNPYVSALLEAILETDSVTHEGSKGRERRDSRAGRHLRLDKHEEARRRCLPDVPRVTRPRGLRSALPAGHTSRISGRRGLGKRPTDKNEEMNRRVETTKNTKLKCQWYRCGRGTKESGFWSKQWTFNPSKACTAGKPTVEVSEDAQFGKGI